MANPYLDAISSGPASQAPTAANAYIDTLSGKNAPPWWQQVWDGAVEGAKDLALGGAQSMVDIVPRVLQGMGRMSPAPLITGPIGNFASALAKRALEPTAADLQDTAAERGSVFSDASRARQSMAGSAASGVVKAAPAIAATMAAPEVFATPAGSTLLGAMQGAMEPTASSDDRAVNMVGGGVLGNLGQRVGGAVAGTAFGARPAANDAARQAFVSWARARGIPLTRAQITGDPFTALLEKIGSKAPGSSGFFEDIGAAQRAGFDKEVGNLTMGGVAGKAMDEFNDVPYNVTPKVVGDVAAVPGQYSNYQGPLAPTTANQTAATYAGTPATTIPNPLLAKMSPPMRQQAIAKGIPEQIETTPATSGALVPGTTIPFGLDNGYLGIRSELGSLAYNAKSNADKAALLSIQDAFDDGAYQSLQAAGVDPSRLIQLRGAVAVDKMLRNARTLNPDGSVTYSPAKVASLIQAKDSKQASFLAGLPGDTGQQLTDLANAGRYLRPTQSSNTTELGMAKGLMAGDVASDLMREGPEALVKPLTALMLVPKVMNTVIQGTRNGVPGLNNFPDAGATLAQILSGAGYQTGRTLAPWAVPAIGDRLGMGQ